MSQWPAGDTATGGQGNPVDLIPCGTPNTTFHVHSHLTIVLNNQLLVVPGQIGMPTVGCTYPLNTQDQSGLLHIEAATAPANNYTLGNLFHIWGWPLAADNIAGIQTQPIVIFITESDGSSTVYHGDPTAIELTSHRLITIQIGSPALTEIPNFTWSGN